MAATENAAELVSTTDAFLFDCDGVLWHGDHLLPGVRETLSYLRNNEKKVIFVTNNATKSRQQYLKKLQGMGITAQSEEVYCSSYAAAAYLQQLGFQKQAFVVGMAGIEDELAAHGIGYQGGMAFPCAELALDEVANVSLDPAIGAVVAGLDPRFCYAKLAHAAALLADPDCLFVATNADSGMNAANGRMLPGAGTIVAALEKATGRTAVVVGKPHALLLDIIVREHRLDRSRTLMVGDRLDTDILFGQSGGLKTLLVLSGVTSQALLDEFARSGGEMPSVVLPSIAELNPQWKQAV